MDSKPNKDEQQSYGSEQERTLKPWIPSQEEGQIDDISSWWGNTWSKEKQHESVFRSDPFHQTIRQFIPIPGDDHIHDHPPSKKNSKL